MKKNPGEIILLDPKTGRHRSMSRDEAVRALEMYDRPWWHSPGLWLGLFVLLAAFVGALIVGVI